MLDTSRTAVLSLYRKLIRNAHKLPKSTQRSFVMERAREQFRIPRKNEEEMILYVRLAHTHIDDLEIQAKTLRIFDRDDRETAQMVASEKQKKQDTMTIEYRRNEKASWESIGADEK